MRSNMDPFQFVDDFYKKQNYVKAYTPVVYTLNGSSLWSKANDRPIQCLDFKKKRRRPKKARIL